MLESMLSLKNDDFLYWEQLVALSYVNPTILLALMDIGLLKYYLVNGVRWVKVKDFKEGYDRYQSLQDEFTDYIIANHLLERARIRYAMNFSSEMLFIEWLSRRKELPEIY
jgi:hypothetical protein